MIVVIIPAALQNILPIIQAMLLWMRMYIEQSNFFFQASKTVWEDDLLITSMALDLDKPKFRLLFCN